MISFMKWFLEVFKNYFLPPEQIICKKQIAYYEVKKIHLSQTIRLLDLYINFLKILILIIKNICNKLKMNISRV